MKRSHRRPSTAFAACALLSTVVTFVALPAAAQGTMAPSQPPSEGGPAAPPSQAPATPPPAPPPPPPPLEVSGPAADTSEIATDAPERKTHQAPPPHTGFQVAARAGVAIPLGDAAQNSPLSDSFGAQFAAIVDIGAKVIPQLFVGAYLGGNVGALGKATSDACDAALTTGCLAFTYRIGVEAQFHIIPDGKVDPWIGYGIGYEVGRITGSSSFGNPYGLTVAGPEFGHVLAGLDFRLTKIFGIGPFVDFSFGKYTSETVDPGSSVSLADRALHEWLTIGAKFLFFP